MFRVSSTKGLFCWCVPYSQPGIGQAPSAIYLQVHEHSEVQDIFQTIFLCLPVPRGSISLQRIKMLLHLETLNKFEHRQGQQKIFHIQQMISNWFRQELDQYFKKWLMSRETVMTRWKSGNRIECSFFVSQTSENCSIWWLKIRPFIKQAPAYTTVLL